MKLNQFLEILDSAPADHQIYFDFCGCVPTTIGSWRGIYAEPALGWEPAGYSGNVKEYPTARILAERIRNNLCDHQGWKGGTYSYDGSEELHIDNRGDYTGTEIDRIEVGKYSIVIHTRKSD